MNLRFLDFELKQLIINVKEILLMKKCSFFIALTMAFLLVIGCNNGNQSASGDADYDTGVFNVPMRAALEASQDFVKQSVKSSASRAAFVELDEDDKWEGFINNNYGNNWNVPSSIYGTSLTTADNTLVINGEELGTLQELVFHKEKINGHDCFTKAVFEYKGYLYYVRDIAEGKTGGYVVLCSEDDLNHICFTQDGKTNSKDFSNFKIWTWTKAGDGKLYRNGNLGYAYTLRNVKMLDGSYATVTVSGYNYYNYGLRVWIQETDGKTVKKNYPNTVYKPDYTPAVDMSKYYASSDSEVDFIFEITNKTTKNLVVANFIKDSRVSDNDLAVVTKTEDFDLAPGEKAVFKYKADSILADFDDNYVFCNFCYEKGAEYKSSAWYYYLGNYIKGERVFVAQTDSQNNGGEKHAYFPIDFVSKDKFEVKESILTVANDKVNDYVKANFPKNENGQYIYYMYNISDFKSGYEFYYNHEVFYSLDGNEIGNMYYSSCKDKIEQMLNNGSFTENVYDYMDILILNSYPQ